MTYLCAGMTGVVVYALHELGGPRLRGDDGEGAGMTVRAGGSERQRHPGAASSGARDLPGRFVTVVVVYALQGLGGPRLRGDDGAGAGMTVRARG